MHVSIYLFGDIVSTSKLYLCSMVETQLRDNKLRYMLVTYLLTLFGMHTHMYFCTLFL